MDMVLNNNVYFPQLHLKRFKTTGLIQQAQDGVTYAELHITKRRLKLIIVSVHPDMKS